MARAPIKKRALQNVSEHTEKGGLHRTLGIPQGQKIPASKLVIHPGDSTKEKKEKVLAHTYEKHRP